MTQYIYINEVSNTPDLNIENPFDYGTVQTHFPITNIIQVRHSNFGFLKNLLGK